jgi:hypothetical protein
LFFILNYFIIGSSKNQFNMKKSFYQKFILLGIIFAFWSSHLIAQVSTGYVFSQTAGTYTPLSGAATSVAKATSLSGIASLDDANYPVTLPFTFNYDGNNYTSMFINTNGKLWLNATAPSTTDYSPLSNTSISAGIICALGLDLNANYYFGDTGSIKTEVIGVSPNREFVIQWENFKPYSTSIPTAQYYKFNFQIRLSEGSNNINVVYDFGIGTNGGALTTLPTSTSCQVGLRGPNNTFTTNVNNRLIGLTDTWAASLPGTANSSICNVSSTLLPVSGQTYTWAAPAPCSGTPTPGTIAQGSFAACENTPFTLTLSGNTAGPGITYQWYFNGSAIASATSSSYTETYASALSGPYYCEVTCAGNPPAQTPSINITTQIPSNCYCITGLGGFCTSVPITNVTINGTGINNTSTCNTVGGQAYTNFVPGSGTSSTLLKGVPYTISVATTGTPSQVKVYIDYNKNGLWTDAGETITVCAPCSGTGPYTTTFTVPTTAVTDSTRMRVRSRAGTIADACQSIGSGETEDYTVYLDAGSNCSGTPSAGNAYASATAFCAGSSVTLSDTGFTIGSGITLQWFENGLPIAGATNATYTFSPTANGAYYCAITCASSATTTNSNTINLTLNAPSNCYCETGLGGVCGSGSITNVTLSSTTINNTSTCNTLAGQAYTNFAPSASTSSTLFKGAPYTVSVATVGTPTQVKVYIDYNKNGLWTDPGEEIIVCSACSGAGPYTTTFIVPTSAVTDSTRMRVRTRQATIANACENIGSGETEDYTVYLDAGTACTGTPTAGISVANDTTACALQPINLSLSGNVIAAGLTYQWYANGNIIPNDTSSSATVTQTATTSYYCVVTCSASGLFSQSTPVTVVQNGPALCLCTSGATSTADEDIGNVTIGSFSNGTGCPNPANSNANANSTGYTDFKTSLPPLSILKTVPTPATVCVINAGANYYPTKVKIFIDINGDGVLVDTLNSVSPTGEVFLFQQLSNQANDRTATGSIIIPASAVSDTVVMRVLADETGPAAPCGTYTWGETEDYLVILENPIPCSGTPNAGSVSTSDSSVCFGANAIFNLSGQTQAGNISYQWQFNGSNLPNDTNAFLSTTINAAGTYQCIVTCNNGGASATSTAVAMTLNPFNQCYCVNNLGSSCTTNAITNVSLAGISNTLNSSSGCSVGAYTLYPDTGSNTTSIYTLAPYTLNTTFNGNVNAGVWIDYNQNGIYEASEYTLIANGTTSGTAVSTTITIPPAAILGLTGMRIRSVASFNTLTAADACTNFFSSETEDYSITIVASTNCAGAPVVGNAVSTDTLVCSNGSFNLSLSGLAPASGLTFQWQANGNNMLNDTLPSVSGVTQSATTTYTCIVTCIFGGQQTISGPVTVTQDTPANCVCIPAFINGCSGDQIEEVSINGVVNNSGTTCPLTPFHTIFSSPTMTANPGDTTICVFKHGTQFNHFINVWIDYNNDFQFSDPERVITNLPMPNTSASVSAYFIASSNPADSGLHKMRVLQNFSVAVVNPQSCGTTYTYGETEDYNISISDTVTTVLSIGGQLAKNAAEIVKVFPNPTSGILYYNVSNNAKSVNISLLDLLGRTVVSKKADASKQLDLSELRNGTYLLNMTVDGKTFQTKVVLNK